MTAQSSPRKEIDTFRSLRTLRGLNVAAVGASLAAATGSVLFALMSNDGSFAVASAFTTLVFGAGWAALLRSRRTIKGTPLRWGWLASIPLAMGNAACACALLVASSGGSLFEDLVRGALLGATFGAIIWLPALLATLAAFGLPIAWAQKRAEKGLAGEERGELVIGVVCAVIALLSLVLVSQPFLFPGIRGAPVDATGSLAAISALAVLGLTFGALASAFAVRRESVRRRFVRDVEAGTVQGYRVDETAEGKVLLRVTSMGTGYRVANFEEHLVELDEKGEARRARL